MLKYSSKTGKIKMSRVAWYYIGSKSKWISTIASSCRNKQAAILKNAKNIDLKLIKLASDDQLVDAVRNSVVVQYGKSFTMRENDEVIDEVAAIESVKKAFEALLIREPKFKEQIRAYVAAGKGFTLSVYFSQESKKNYLVPTFNGVGISELKSVFTASTGKEVGPPTNTKTYEIGDTGLRGVGGLVDLVKMINAAGFITSKSVVEIGSIGSRSTNWDTSYNLNIEGMSNDKLQQILTWFTNIDNKDVRNLTQEHKRSSFNLTMFQEVNNLMSRFGLGKLFIDKVKAIKEYEEAKGLKRKHQRDGRIEDYKNKTKIETIRLADHAEEVFSSMLGKATSNPTYVALMQEHNVGDPQEFLGLAFSMGQDGYMINQDEAKDLIEMSSSV